MSDDDRLAAIEAEMERLRAEVRYLRRELETRGLTLPPEMAENPDKTPMSPEGLRSLKQKLAAHARASKPIGKGKGAVSSPEVKKRLESQDKLKKK